MAQNIGYAIILVGFIFQVIFCSNYGILLNIFFADKLKIWIKIIKEILRFYPPFNMSKLYSDIAKLSSDIYNEKDEIFSKGPGFHWNDMYHETILDDFLGMKIIVNFLLLFFLII